MNDQYGLSLISQKLFNQKPYTGPDTIVRGPRGPEQGYLDLDEQREAYRKPYHRATRRLGQAATGEDK